MDRCDARHVPRLTKESLIERAQKPAIGRGASQIAGASAIAGASSLIISWIAARALTPEETAQFLVFWGLLFGIYGTLSGVQAETTRAVGSALINPAARATGARVLTAGLLIGAGSAAIILMSAPLWGPKLLPSDRPWIVLFIALAALGYAGHSTLAGAAAGLKRWRLYSMLMSSEALARLALVALVAATASSLFGVESACIAAVGVWLLFLMTSRTARTVILARSDVSLPRLLRNNSYSLVSAAATAALIVGFPIIFGLAVSPAELASSAALLLAVQLTRAPIMIPLQALQGLAIATFVDRRDRGLKNLVRPIAAIAAVAVFGAALAWAFGPGIMSLFGPDYAVNGLLLAVLTLAGGAVGVLTLTGSAALAAGSHRSFMLGWVAATGTTFVVMLVSSAPVDARVALGLCTGPLTGILMHLLGTSRQLRRSSATEGPLS